MERETFVFYKEWAEAISDLPSEIRLEIYEGIIEYATTGKIPNLKMTARVGFNFVKNKIDKDLIAYQNTIKKNRENGKKGGRPKNPKNPMGFQETQPNPKNLDNDNEYDNDISFLEKKKQKIYIGDSEQKSEKEDFSEPQDEKTQVETQKEKRKKVAPKKEKENKPQISEFLDYCKDLIEKKQLGDFSALKFGLEAKYNQWAQNNWRDGYNEPIKNWKTKIQNTLPHIKPIKNATNTITNSYNQPQGQKTAFRSILAQQLSQSTASNPSTGSQAIDVEAVIVE